MQSKSNREFGYTAAGSGPDIQAMRKQMRELSEQCASVPNRIVTTDKVVAALAAHVAPHDGPAAIGGAQSFAGMPIESYATVKECLDRMMVPAPGERLQLVLSEDIPVECISHPWIKRQIDTMCDRYNVGLLGL